MIRPSYVAQRLIALLLVFLFSTEGLAKKNFRGLFGSYRREKYVENEGRSTAFGINLHLSSLIPVSPIVKSSEVGVGDEGEALHFSTFFNFEVEAFVTLGYHLEIFGRLGYMSYDTRKETTLGGPPPGGSQDLTHPIFHAATMKIIPYMGGIRYRFGRDDIVPYLGLALGLAYVERRVNYDNNPLGDGEFVNAVVGELGGGLEFFFAPNAGMRIEVAAFYMNLSERQYATGGSPQHTPVFNWKSNPWSVRYASGVFVLF